MSDWEEFVNGSSEDLNNTENVKKEEFNDLDDTSLLKFCERLSGRSVFLENNAKASITYQCYNGLLDEKKLDDDASIIYELKLNTYANLSYDAYIPDILKLDLVFPTFDCPEIRLMWARLQKFQESQTKMQKDFPVFLIHLAETEAINFGLMDENEEVENLLEVSLINPVMFYLTRQIPSDPAIETENANGEVIGGNIIRLIFDMRLARFEMTDLNVTDSKAEAIRENMYET